MMRNRFYVFCLALMAALMVQAQELVRTEYFIDTDPGYGNAASVSTPLLGLNSIELDLDGVLPGAHLLCLRTVDSNGRWSATTMHPILVKGPDNDGTVARIEYFFDSDPGYGQGRSAENPTTGESQYALSVDGLTQGAHMLFIRATDNQGRWSEVTSKSIFVINNGRGEVTRIEYFFDTDPGFGQATAIENPQNGEANYALSIDGLSQGAHTLYLRAADDRGIWSSVIAHPLYVCGPTTGIAALEYFFDDNDPGEGQATQVTLPENPLEQFVFSADASALAEGDHTLNVRAKGTDGIWRLISNRIFAVTTSVPGDSEPYAVLSDDNTVLTFYYDDQKESRGGMSVGPFTRLYYDDESQNNKVNGRGWDNTVTSVVFDESFANCTTLTSTAYWFFDCSNLTSITNIEYLKTDNVTDMNNMFCNCRGLTSLNVTNFKTENVTDMGNMFYVCSGLTSLDVTNFKTENVTNMSLMFFGCSGLTSLDVTNFKTDNVTNMNGMFVECSGLTSLDVTNFKTDNVMNMAGMFINCIGLTTLDVTGFKTDNVTDMNSMFAGCNGLTSLDMSNFKTDNVTDMNNMFEGCWGLTSLDVTSFKTGNVTDMSNMFNNCRGLTSLDVTSFNTENVTNMSKMFEYCSGLTSLDVTSFKTDKVTEISYMFEGCSGLTSLDVSSFKTDNVTNLFRMFASNPNLKTIYASSDWNTAAVQIGSDMFIGCTSLVGGMGTVYDADHTDHTYAHIDGGESNPGYFTDKNPPVIADAEPYAVLSDNNTVLTFYYDDQKVARGGMDVGPFTRQGTRGWNQASGSITTVVFDESFANCTSITSTSWWFSMCSKLTTVEGLANLNTSSVTNMGNMFFGCSSLTSLDLSSFNTSNVTYMDGMFRGCSALTDVDLTSFETENLHSTNSLFYECESLKTVDLSSFSTPELTDAGYMFFSCSELTTIYASDLWSTEKTTTSDLMFSYCNNLVGGNGTVFTTEHTDKEYARIDREGQPGYFTDKNASAMAEAYAVLSDSSTVLTFYYDDQKEARGGMSVGPFNASDYQTWYAERRSITTVVFDESFANCTTLTSTAYWFYECSNLTSITNIEFLKTDNVTNMSEMFSNCSGLTSLDVSNFKTDNVTDMSYMFSGCWNITRLDVSGFNTEHVTNIGYMFEGCSNLTSLDVSGFKTDNVWGMYGMFAHCSNLKNLDVSRFNTANVTDMRFMFRNCSSLTSIDVSGFNTANVTDMYGMFSGCTKLTSLDVSRFNTANVREMAYMFSLSSGLTSLDLSGFNTSNVTNMREMFEGCSNLTTIYASSDWSTEAVEYGNDMFYACTNLVGGMGTVYDENNVDYTYAHIDGGTANPGYFTDKNAPAPVGDMAYAVLSDNNTVLTFYYDDQMQARGGMSVGPFTYTYDGTYITDVVRPGWFGQRESITRVIFDVSFANCTSLTSTAFWFYRCNNLTTITGIEHLKTDNVTDMGFMFDGCSSLTSLDVSGFNTTNVERFCALFAGCSSLTSIDVSHFNTSNAWDFRLMFSQCSSLTELDVSHFNTQKATGMGGMFQVCSKLTKLDLHNFNTENVFGMGWMFTGCSSLLDLDISGFNTSSAGEMFYMFDECPSLASIMAGNAVIPDSIYAQIGNPNLLVYVNSEATAPTIINNVVVNGVARNIVLTDALTGYGNFNCPQAFRAEHISYRHNFHQETQPGVSRGWEGIALPFNVQTITHEHHGVLHPFGTPEEGYPFWLRQLTPNGIVQAVRMIANRPYIISMPNSQAYHDEYNQSGWVTFAANDVTVPVTTTMVTALADSSIVMIPTMQRVEQATDVYAINRSQPYAGYPEGSIFVSNLREVRPFEAYTEHRSASPAPMFYPIDAWMDGGTGVDEMENELLTIDNAYNLNGQRVKTPRKGVFIVNGRKTVVK